MVADSVRNGRTASWLLFSIAARTVKAHPTMMTPILLLRIVAAAWFFAALCRPAVADDNELISELNEEVVQIPVTVGSATGQHAVSLTATTFHPKGNGPFPLIVLSHGNPPNAADRPAIGRFRRIPQVKEFLNRGFAVLVPIRRGYGATGGNYAESYARCDYASFTQAGAEAARDLIASIDFAKKLPFVNPAAVILVGQSAGGFASLAAASLKPAGLIAVVNFSGGRGGDPQKHPGVPCGARGMAETIGKFGETIDVPVLWHYVENDLFFGPEYAKLWFAAFEKSGGKGVLVIQPAFGKNGHSLFTTDSGIAIWTVQFDKFLKENRLVPHQTSLSANRMAAGERKDDVLAVQ